MERIQLDVPSMLRQLGVNENDPVLVAGSTHAGEEIILAEICIACGSGIRSFFWCWCLGI